MEDGAGRRHITHDRAGRNNTVAGRAGEPARVERDADREPFNGLVRSTANTRPGHDRRLEVVHASRLGARCVTSSS